MAADRIGKYAIIGEAGRGGMGIVYHALDESLDRDVAIKVLPDSMVFNTKRMARFQREGKLLASLNHPNIAAIYEVDNEDSRPYVVLEYVSGDTLAEIIRRRPVPWKQMLPIAIQIAEAIEYAHQEGVIHRDIKPQNVKFDAKGNVKVLDFGLAKAIEDEEATEDASSQQPSPDAATVLNLSRASQDQSSTRPGMMMGTIGYLSPEQACGHEVDKQTDIFSFGCILFEMLTGDAPFASESAVDAIGRTLHKDPAWEQLPTDTPSRLKTLLRRCLAKDKKDRLRDIGDARLELIELRDFEHEEHTEASTLAGRTYSWRVPTSTIIVVIIAAITFAWLYLFDRSSSSPSDAIAIAPLSHRSVSIPDKLKLDAFSSSADDDYLRVVCFEEMNPDRKGGKPNLDWRLYVRPRDSAQLREIHHFTELTGYTFSPDGESFVLNTKGHIYRGLIDSTAAPIELARVPNAQNAVGGFAMFPAKRGVVWFDDETIIVEAADENGQHQIVLLDARTGDLKKTIPIKLDSNELRLDGLIGKFDDDHVLMYVSLYNSEGFSINIATVSLSTGKLEVLVERAGFAQVIENHLFFSRGDSLYMAPFNPETHELLDAGHPVMEGLHSDYGTHGSFNITDNGTLVLKPGGIKGGKRRLLLNTPDGIQPSGLRDASFHNSLSVSGDGSQICTTIIREDGMWEIWGGTFDPPRMRQIMARTDADYCYPMLSYDGSTLGCVQIETTSDGIEFAYMVVPTDGARPSHILNKFKREDQVHMRCFNLDNTRILGDRPNPNQANSQRHLIEFDVETGKVTEFLSRAGGASEGLWSPDGSLVSFKTIETGTPELYLYNPDTKATIRVSDIPVGMYRWMEHSDGTLSLIYWDSDWDVWESTVGLEANGELLIGEPKPYPLVLSKTALLSTLDNRGNAYVIEAGLNDAPPNHIVVIENWLPSVLTEEN
ncbi:MAG: protein kinase [Phycisphaerales bacterium]|nr:protein kinase [Phycisphaerales bacterium]